MVPLPHFTILPNICSSQCEEEKQPEHWEMVQTWAGASGAAKQPLSGYPRWSEILSFSRFLLL